MEALMQQLGATSWCEGIVGDGCGGGRLFFTDATSVQVYDPTTQETMTLLGDLQAPKELTKKGCLLFFVEQGQKMRFDLSLMRLIS